MEPAPLEMELEDIRQRLEKLQRSELQRWPEGTRKRIERAIKGHQAREAQLLAAIEGVRHD